MGLVGDGIGRGDMVSERRRAVWRRVKGLCRGEGEDGRRRE